MLTVTKMQLRKHGASLDQEWTTFVNACPHAMMYHHLNYQQLIKKVLNVESENYCALNSDGKICAVLPLLYKEGPLGKVFNSLPFYGSNGGILSNDAEAFKFLLSEYNRMAENPEIASSTIISNPLKPEEDYTGVLHNFKDYRIGQFSDIEFDSDNAEKLMNMFHYKTRNMVRKAMKEGITVKEDSTALEFLYDTHCTNMQAIGGKPKPRVFFESFPDFYKAGSDFKIFTASIGNELIAALLLFYCNATVEYYTPVIVEKYRDKQALSLLIYTAMTEASVTGYKRWNWGGTWATQGGVYTFKKRWGTKDINYYYYTQLNNQAILNASKEELLKHYNNFFVLAFDKLKSNG